MHDLEQVRRQLIGERKALFRRAAKTEDELLWLETDVEPEVQERGQQEKLVRFLDQMETRLKTEIEAIDQALVRLSAGQYGFCEQCRGDIPDGRLLALPATMFYVACVQARETVGA
ncbi:MAG: TraR/DksA C4-type zinc finger protein [Nitrospira sp.]|nr:TraR/DksA C4-type zinc finger protein [Nitrospira sp.]